MSGPAKKSGYIVTSVDSARIDAQWERIARRLPAQRTLARRRSVSAPGFAVALVALCALGTVWWVRSQRGAMKQGVDQGWAGSLVASDDAPMSFTLTEGTHIDVAPNSQLELLQNADDHVTVALARGAARFDVAKRRARRFSVRVGATEVVVTGTQFYVSRRNVPDGERMRVEVEEGAVEVHRAGQPVVTLHQGDHWAGDVPSEYRLRQVDDSAPTDDVSAPNERDDELDEMATDDVTRRSPQRRRAHTPSEHGSEQAAQLFEEANELRRAGELRAAASLFAQLVLAYPKDRRAALSAFELGRLRMDSLGDVPGAIEALEGALKLDARRSFAEDALARLVTAHEALKERDPCLKARERYLARYPEGVHAQRLAASCAQLQ